MTRLIYPTIILLLCWAAPVSADGTSGIDELLDRETAGQIEFLLGNLAPALLPLPELSSLPENEQVVELYLQRQYRPAWFSGRGLRPEAQMLLETLRDSPAHGLCNDDYLLDQLEGLFRLQAKFAERSLPLAAESRALLDLFLSRAFITFATHMMEGQVDPSLAHVDWSARRRRADPVKLLDYAVTNQRLSQVLTGLIPPHQEYAQLVEVLGRYREISARGGWPQLPPGPTIRPGGQDARVPLLRNLLLITGDLGSDPAPANLVFDPATKEAVRMFQGRHGLKDDGVVGPQTMAVLNVPVEERIRQIELNLERWRWMPKSFGTRHIRVNIADFSLQVVEDGEVALQMPVIVGTQYRKTPVFSAWMTYLEFAPYWTVPQTILREDKLPKIRRNPGYLAEHHYRVMARNGTEEIDPNGIDWRGISADAFPGLLRMDPGPWNPLGRVKFMFPNSYDVYLHDTNERHLFDNSARSFSSGCIRVKQPEALADYLLQGKHAPAELQRLFRASEPERVRIDPLPVHILYWTAWVDADGLVQFRPDVYFRDLDLEIALNEPAYRILERLLVGSGPTLAGP